MSAKKKKKSRGPIITLLVIALLALIALFTNPGANEHRDVFADVAAVAAQNAVQQSVGTNDMNPLAGLLVNVLANPVANVVAQSTTEYHNYYLFSTTSMLYYDQEHTVTFGLFGKVFTISEAKLKDIFLSQADAE